MAFWNVLTLAGSTLTGGIRALSWRDGLSVHRMTVIVDPRWHSQGLARGGVVAARRRSPTRARSSERPLLDHAEGRIDSCGHQAVRCQSSLNDRRCLRA